jgi:dihydrofolate reductase
MRRVIGNYFVSLDGVFEAPDTWHFPYFNDEMGTAMGQAFAATDTVLMGRVLYEEWATFWPSAPPGDASEFADFINNVRKFVVSKTLDEVAWNNATLIRDNVADRIAELKRQPGNDISVLGSGTLGRWLLTAGLLDELRLMVHPIIVGSGRKLFEEPGDQQPLELVKSATFTTGVLNLTYRPAQAS